MAPKQRRMSLATPLGQIQMVMNRMDPAEPAGSTPQFAKVKAAVNSPGAGDSGPSEARLVATIARARKSLLVNEAEVKASRERGSIGTAVDENTPPDAEHDKAVNPKASRRSSISRRESITNGGSSFKVATLLEDLKHAREERIRLESGPLEKSYRKSLCLLSPPALRTPLTASPAHSCSAQRSSSKGDVDAGKTPLTLGPEAPQQSPLRPRALVAAESESLPPPGAAAVLPGVTEEAPDREGPSTQATPAAQPQPALPPQRAAMAAGVALVSIALLPRLLALPPLARRRAALLAALRSLPRAMAAMLLRIARLLLRLGAARAAATMVLARRGAGALLCGAARTPAGQRGAALAAQLSARALRGRAVLKATAAHCGASRVGAGARVGGAFIWRALQTRLGQSVAIGLLWRLCRRSAAPLPPVMLLPERLRLCIPPRKAGPMRKCRVSLAIAALELMRGAPAEAGTREDCAADKLIDEQQSSQEDPIEDETSTRI